MVGWSLNELIIAFTLTCLALIPCFALVYWVVERSALREGNASKLPMPDWSRIDSYTELAEVASQAYGKLAPEAFLDGPFRRYLELASEPDDYPRARARIMEFGRSTLDGYRVSLAERGGDAKAFEVRARAMAAEWFARPEVPSGDYMLEVLDGISNHNYRGKREA